MLTVALTVLVLDFFMDKEQQGMLGWFSLAGVLIAAVASYR